MHSCRQALSTVSSRFSEKCPPRAPSSRTELPPPPPLFPAPRGTLHLVFVCTSSVGRRCTEYISCLFQYYPKAEMLYCNLARNTIEHNLNRNISLVQQNDTHAHLRLVSPFRLRRSNNQLVRDERAVSFNSSTLVCLYFIRNCQKKNVPEKKQCYELKRSMHRRMDV